MDAKCLDPEQQALLASIMGAFEIFPVNMELL